MPVETFVVFFADALLADVATTRLTATERLLDEPAERSAVELPVTQRLWTGVTEFQQALASLRQASQSSPAAPQGMLDAELRVCLDACASFTARFRRIVGMPPGEFREEIRKHR